jgi:hypothetical protein
MATGDFFGPPPRAGFITSNYGFIRFDTAEDVCHACGNDDRNDQLDTLNVCKYWATGQPCNFYQRFAHVDQMIGNLMHECGGQRHPRFINKQDMLKMVQCTNPNCCSVDCKYLHGNLSEMTLVMADNCCELWLAECNTYGMSTRCIWSCNGEVHVWSSHTGSSPLYFPPLYSQLCTVVPGPEDPEVPGPRVLLQPPEPMGRISLLERMMLDLQDESHEEDEHFYKILQGWWSVFEAGPLYGPGLNRTPRVREYANSVRVWLQQNMALIPVPATDRFRSGFQNLQLNPTCIPGPSEQ